MRSDEALVFKTFDSAVDGRTRFTLHSSCKDPMAPADAPPRESIETRCMLFFLDNRSTWSYHKDTFSSKFLGIKFKNGLSKNFFELFAEFSTDTEFPIGHELLEIRQERGKTLS